MGSVLILQTESISAFGLSFAMDLTVNISQLKFSRAYYLGPVVANTLTDFQKKETREKEVPGVPGKEVAGMLEISLCEESRHRIMSKVYYCANTDMTVERSETRQLS